jgi:hypothetical protein
MASSSSVQPAQQGYTATQSAQGITVIGPATSYFSTASASAPAFPPSLLTPTTLTSTDSYEFEGCYIPTVGMVESAMQNGQMPNPFEAMMVQNVHSFDECATLVDTIFPPPLIGHGKTFGYNAGSCYFKVDDKPVFDSTVQPSMNCPPPDTLGGFHVARQKAKWWTY